MRILPQFARLTPTRLSSVRFWLRVLFIVGGAILIYRAEQERIVLDAQYEVEMQAYKESLQRDYEDFSRKSDERMASIYRSLNTIFSYAGVDQIGDGE